MDCFKLTYYKDNKPLLKCVWNKNRPEKPAQWFCTVDPLAENYFGISPYVYCANNPVIFVDPDGMAYRIVYGENGFIWSYPVGDWEAYDMNFDGSYSGLKEGYSDVPIFSSASISDDGGTQGRGGDLSKHLLLVDVIRSETASELNIDNTPTAEHLQNLEQYGKATYDQIFEHFNGNIKISSGYRNPTLNAAIGGSTTSQHSLGEALDIQAISPLTNSEIFYYVKDNLNYHQLIWEYGDINNPNWVHVGYRPNGNNGQQVFSIPKGLKTFK